MDPSSASRVDWTLTGGGQVTQTTLTEMRHRLIGDFRGYYSLRSSRDLDDPGEGSAGVREPRRPKPRAPMPAAVALEVPA